MLKSMFLKLKEEFYAPPAPETAERGKHTHSVASRRCTVCAEIHLKSLKNIALLYLEAMLFKKRMLLSDVSPRVDSWMYSQCVCRQLVRQADEGGKGYLSHEEAGKIIGSIGIALTDEQVLSRCITCTSIVRSGAASRTRHCTWRLRLRWPG
jgi:hypothetical protein